MFIRYWLFFECYSVEQTYLRISRKSNDAIGIPEVSRYFVEENTNKLNNAAEQA